MPINMAVQEPRTRVVRSEPEGYIVRTSAHTDDIPTNRICVVVCRAPGDAHNIKGMAVKMDRVLWVIVEF